MQSRQWNGPFRKNINPIWDWGYHSISLLFLLFDYKKFSDVKKKEIKSKGYIYRFTDGYDESYRITNKLLEDWKKHLILNKQINITIPIKIFHGMRDNSVPWKLSLELMESLKSDNVDIQLIKNGDHSLSSKKDLSALGSNILDYYE